MATMTQTIRPFSRAREVRKLTAIGSLTLFGLIILLAYLLPIAYMALTSVKSIQQVEDANSTLLPTSPTTISYQGQDLPLYYVPLPDGTTKVLALLTPYREDSLFVDPNNLTAAPYYWTGRWRTLAPVNHIDPTWGNYQESWNAINMGILFRNTFIIAIAGTIGTLLSSILVAYGFARFRMPFANVLFIVLIGTIILPAQVTLIPTYIFFRFVGWGGTWWPLIIPHFFANAYNVFLLRQYFRGIPKDLDEAAMIDGASPIQVLLRVIIPQSWPVILAVSMFHFFFAWNDFFAPLVYLAGKEDLYTISIGLTRFTSAYSTQPGLLQAAAVMAITLPVVIFFLAQRVFMQGIVITGVEK